MRGIVCDGASSSRVDAGGARPATGRGAGRDPGRRALPQRRERGRRHHPVPDAGRARPRGRRRRRGGRRGGHQREGRRPRRARRRSATAAPARRCDRGQPTHCRDIVGKLSRAVHRSTASKAFQFANVGVVRRVHGGQGQTRPCRSTRTCPLEVGVAHRLRRPHRRRRRAQPGQGRPRPVGRWSSASAASASTSSRALRLVGLRCRSSPSTPTRRRRRWPAQFGATHFIDVGRRSTPPRRVKEICPNGVDFAFECVGHPGAHPPVDRPARLGRHRA